MDQKTHDAIQAALNDILDQHITQPINLWPRIQRELAPRAQRPMGRRWTWQIALTGVLLVLVVTVYAVNNLLKQALSEDQGLVYVSEQGLGQEVAVEQSTDDAVLKLEWIYADSNRISLGYTLTMLDGTVFGDPVPQPRTYLMDDEGHLFGETYQYNSRDGSQVAYVQNFDTSHLRSLPDTLNLRLIGSFEALSNPPGRFIGPFNLRFSLATTAERKLSTPLTVDANGMILTLRSVITTPSMTRIEICSENLGSWQFSYTLTIGGALQSLEPTYKTQYIDCLIWIYDVSLTNVQGSWTLSVAELIDYWTPLYETPDLFDRLHEGENFDSIAAALEERGLVKRITGPWTFTFTLDS